MCDCITLMNEALEPHNGKLDIPLIINYKTGQQILPHRVQIQTYKLETKKRGKVPTLLANYCPFCGDRYQWPDPQEMSNEELAAEIARACRQHEELRRRHADLNFESIGRATERTNGDDLEIV